MSLPTGWKLRHISGPAGTGSFSKALYDASKTCVGQYTFDGYGIPLPWRVGATGYATQPEALAALIKETTK